jgi:hypothetical protein
MTTSMDPMFYSIWFPPDDEDFSCNDEASAPSCNAPIDYGGFWIKQHHQYGHWGDPTSDPHNSPWYNRGRTVHTAVSNIARLGSLLGGSVSASGVAQNSHPSGKTTEHTSWGNLSSKLNVMLCISCGKWPDVAFLAGFTISTLCFYHLNSQDEFQDYAIFLGLIGGVAIGFGIGKGLEETLLLVIPWTLLLSLVMSGIGHGFMRHWTRTRTRSLSSRVECDVQSPENKGDLKA